MNYTSKQTLIIFVLFSLFSLHGMEQPHEDTQPTFQCKVPFDNDEFPDEIPVGENAYYTTLLYNENDTSYYYEPDPQNPSKLIRKNYDATFDLVYHKTPPTQHYQTQSSSYFNSRRSSLTNSSRSFAQSSAYYADRDFAIENYLHVYNQLNEYQQTQFAHENERLHELAMRKVAYDNQPPFRQRVKASFQVIGQKLSTTKDRINSWWQGESPESDNEKEFDQALTAQHEYHSTAFDQREQTESPHIDCGTHLQQQTIIPSDDLFDTETLLSKLAKKNTKHSQEGSDEDQKSEEKREVIFSSDTYVVNIVPSDSTKQDSSSLSKEIELTKKSSPFPAKKPKEDDKDKKPHGIPQEIREKYEEYKKQEGKKQDLALSKQPPSTGIATVVNKEPMIDVIHKDSKEFVAKLNLPQKTASSNTQSSTPSPSKASVPTSPLSQINTYQNYASSAPTRTPSAQSHSLQIQRQHYTNQISQAARRESSTARAWGGSQERRQLEAERSKIDYQIRLQEARENYSRGGIGRGINFMDTKNSISLLHKRKFKYLLKNDLILEKDKEFINNTWKQLKKDRDRPNLVSENPLKANTTNFCATTDGKVLSSCFEIVQPIHERQYIFVENELLPLLRANNFEQADKLTFKKMDKEDWIKTRRKLEQYHSQIKKRTIIRKNWNEIEEKTKAEYKKLGYVEWFFSWDVYGKILNRKKEEAIDAYTDEISHQKHIEHQQKLAVEKLEKERQLVVERAEQERLQKELELAQKKEANAKLVGEKLEYEAKKIRLRKEFELEQSKKRLEKIIKQINAPRYQRPEKDFVPVTPVSTIRDQIELIVEQPPFLLQDVIAQPALDFISSGPHRSIRTDPQVIAELIADPSTPPNIVKLLERAKALQDTVDNKTLSDLSATATELILFGELISKKMAEKSFARSQEEAKQYDKLKTEIARISTFIIDCVNIAAEEIEKKREEHRALFTFVSKHPIETIKIVTQCTAFATIKLTKLMLALEPFLGSSDYFGDFSDRQMQEIEDSAKKLAPLLAHVDDYFKQPYREQFRGGINFGFDLVAQHLVFKSCARLKTMLRSNFIEANTLKALATTAEERAVVDAAIELASQQKKLICAVEHAFEGNTIPTAENIGRTQRVNEILDLAAEFSQSEKALEIKAVLDRKNALRLIETSKELTELSHIYRKETVIETIKVLEITVKSLEDKEIKKDFLLMIKKIAKLNSHPEWTLLKYNSKGQVTKESIKKALKSIAPYEAKIAKGTIESLCKTQTKDSIWHKIQPTEGLYPETLIPRSFVIDVEGTKLWIHPNATKHFEEFIVSRNIMNEFLGSFVSPARQTLNAQELILNDFYNILKELIKDGIPNPGSLIKKNGWEIIFGTSNTKGAYPLVFHALTKYS